MLPAPLGRSLCWKKGVRIAAYGFALRRRPDWQIDGGRDGDRTRTVARRVSRCIIDDPGHPSGRRWNGISHQSPPECAVQLKVTVAARKSSLYAICHRTSLNPGDYLPATQYRGTSGQRKRPRKNRSLLQKNKFSARGNRRARGHLNLRARNAAGRRCEPRSERSSSEFYQ